MTHIADSEKKEIAGAGVVTDFGAFLSGSVHQCEAYKGQGNDQAACASSVLGMISNLDRVGEIGEQMAKVCAPSKEERLFAMGHASAAPAALNSMNFFFAAFLPITAIVSFAVGRRYANSRMQVAARDIVEPE